MENRKIVALNSAVTFHSYSVIPSYPMDSLSFFQFDAIGYFFQNVAGYFYYHFFINIVLLYSDFKCVIQSPNYKQINFFPDSIISVFKI